MVTDHTTELMFVYRLHGQTGRFTDWTIGKKNSGLVNSIPESRFPFAQISSLFLVAVFHLHTSNWIFPNLFEIGKQLMSNLSNCKLVFFSYYATAKFVLTYRLKRCFPLSMSYLVITSKRKVDFR